MPYPKKALKDETMTTGDQERPGYGVVPRSICPTRKESEEREVEDEKGSGVSGLHHVAVPVDDMAAAVEFYRETLGLSELPAPSGARERGIRWFDLGDGRALHLIPWRASVPRTRAHFALSVKDLRAWRSHLETSGVEMDRPLVDLYGIDRFFVRDPSGNLIEFIEEAE